MAGDHIDIFGKSYYLNTTNITNTNSTTLDVLSLLTNLLLSPGNAAAAKGLTGSQLNTMNNGLIPTSFFRGNNSEPTTTVPKAFINYIFLDEQFKYAGGGASRVGTSGVVKDHWQADGQLQNILVPKNGYIFVYVSNESNFDVFFDNLQVIHKPGPLLEETHYYPFGLTMAGISDKAAGGLENRYKYNGKELQNNEFSDGSGLEAYDYGARMQDPQLGRWMVIDPFAEKFLAETPYNYVGNNPVNNIDIEGKFRFHPGNHKHIKLDRYLKNHLLHDVLNSPRIMKALSKWGNLSESDIKRDLKNNSGPVLEIADKIAFDANGYYTGGKNGILQINSKITDQLENSNNSDREAALLVVVSTILHEYTHFGDDQDGEDAKDGPDFVDGTGNDLGNEVGDLFEMDVYWDSKYNPDRPTMDIDQAKQIINRKNQSKEDKRDLPSIEDPVRADKGAKDKCIGCVTPPWIKNTH